MSSRFFCWLLVSPVSIAHAKSTNVSLLSAEDIVDGADHAAADTSDVFNDAEAQCVALVSAVTSQELEHIPLRLLVTIGQ